MNPYLYADFWNFFLIFFSRIFLFLQGKVPLDALAVDEIQIFVISGVAISSACLGTFLTLRKMTMLANAMSHTILIGIIIAFILTSSLESQKINITAMLIAAIGMGIITTFLTQFLHRFIQLQEDASIGLVFTGLFALGIIVATLWTRNLHLGLEAVMGNADALHADDLTLVMTVLGLNLLLITLFFKEYTITSFDPALSQALGFSLLFFDYLLMVQVSITVISAFRAVGVVMVLAFLTAPPLMARFMVHRLKSMLILSSLYGIIASFLGVAIARHLLSIQGIAMSTAGMVVCVLVIMFLLHMVYITFVRNNASLEEARKASSKTSVKQVID